MKFLLKLFSKNSKVLLFVMFLLFTLQPVFCQRWKMHRYEIFGGISANSLFGDIGGYPSGKNLYGLKDMQIGELRPGFQAGLRYKITSKIWVKGYISYNLFAASDKGSANDARGFSSSSSGFGTGFQAEYAFITEDKKKGRIVSNRKGLLSTVGGMAFYGFSGVRFIYFKPTLTSPTPVLPNETITTYNLALVLPIGVGFKYFMDKKTSIGFELSANFTTTDLLDGYTSSFSKSNDFYYQFNVCFAYKLFAKRNGMPSFSRW